MAIPIHWIRDDAALAEACALWRRLPFVALDTEFMRVDTFYPKAGLVQIGDGERAGRYGDCRGHQGQSKYFFHVQTSSLKKLLPSNVYCLFPA